LNKLLAALSQIRNGDILRMQLALQTKYQVVRMRKREVEAQLIGE
jgi:hypothetical protein